jgi:hypothetical protein
MAAGPRGHWPGECLHWPCRSTLTAACSACDPAPAIPILLRALDLVPPQGASMALRPGAASYPTHCAQ